jgi:hypothetical protein
MCSIFIRSYCLKIQNNYIRGFLDKHIKGKNSELLNGPSPEYLEVEIKIKIGNSSLPPNYSLIKEK